METSKKGASKLTPERVNVIKQLFQFKDIKDGEIAQCFGVSRECINTIRNGHRWGDVTGIKVKTGNDFRQFTKTKDEVIKDNIRKQLINHLLEL